MKLHKRKKIFLVGGTRPNFVKIAPLWWGFKNHKKEFDVKIVNVGQHYDYEMSRIFFDEFRLPKPHYTLDILPGSHGSQTGQIIIKFEELLINNIPDLVIVVGDVNSTLAAALVSVKLQVPVAHVESGLRSFDSTMPEEINRILTDRISNMLFVSEPSGLVNLKNEGITDSVYLVGNVMIDSLKNNIKKIKSISTSRELGFKNNDYGVITMHRPSNVDSKQSLKKMIQILQLLTVDRKFVFPMHPRTEKNLISAGLYKKTKSIKNLTIIKSLGYFEFMNLIINSAVVVTDSGGIQEETTWLGIPCITLRENTERPITVATGTNTLTGLNMNLIRKTLKNIKSFNSLAHKPPPLWDGKTAKRIIVLIKKFMNSYT